MITKFIRSFTKISVVLGTLLALALVGFGLALLVKPECIHTIVKVLSGALALAGGGVIVSVLCAGLVE